MIPIPQYPLYSATITLYEGKQVGYYLDEGHDWKLSQAMLEESLQEARRYGVKVKAICVLNPGNPTGSVLDRDNIRMLIGVREIARPVDPRRRGLPGERVPARRPLRVVREGDGRERRDRRQPVQLPLLLEGVPGRVRPARRVHGSAERPRRRHRADHQAAVGVALREPDRPGGHLLHGAAAAAGRAFLTSGTRGSATGSSAN